MGGQRENYGPALEKPQFATQVQILTNQEALNNALPYR